MKKTFQITPQEASSIYATQARNVSIPLTILAIAVGVIYSFVTMGISTKIIGISLAVVVFACLLMLGMLYLAKKYLAPKMLTMKYELGDDQITQTFPNGHQVSFRFEDIKKIDQGIFGTNFKVSLFKGINIFKDRSGHDEILEYVKTKINQNK